MDEKKLDSVLKQVKLLLKTVLATVSFLLLLLILIVTGSLDTVFTRDQLVKNETPPDVVDGIHVSSGLVDAPGLQLVITNCTGCHSSRLIIQNRMNLAGWSSTIKWMQETQNLWDLGKNEDAILTYLAANYAPTKKGRRANLTNIEWYELE